MGSRGRETAPPHLTPVRRVTYPRGPSFYGGPDTPICQRIKQESDCTAQAQTAPDGNADRHARENPQEKKKKTPSETPRIPTAIPSQSPSDRKEAAASPATPAPSSSPSCTFRRRPARLAGNTVIDVSGPRAVCPWGPNPAERHWAPGVCAGGPYRTHQASLRQIQQGAEIQRSSKGSHPVPTPFVVGPQQGTGVRSGKQRHGPSVSF